MKLTGGPRETAVTDCVIVASMSTYEKFHFDRAYRHRYYDQARYYNNYHS